MKIMNSSPPKRLTLTAVAGKRRQALRHRIDQPVADRMAERVVDALEVVEVEHGEAAEPVAIAGRQRLGDEFVEIGAVRQAGQIVERAIERDLVLGLDALGDVLEGDDAEFLVALAGRGTRNAGRSKAKRGPCGPGPRAARASVAPR